MLSSSKKPFASPPQAISLASSQQQQPGSVSTTARQRPPAAPSSPSSAASPMQQQQQQRQHQIFLKNNPIARDDARVTLREAIRAIIANPKRYGPLFTCVSDEYKFVASLGEVSSTEPHFFDSLTHNPPSLFDDDDDVDNNNNNNSMLNTLKNKRRVTVTTINQMRKSLGNALVFTHTTDVRDDDDDDVDDNDNDAKKKKKHDEQRSSDSSSSSSSTTTTHSDDDNERDNSNANCKHHHHHHQDQDHNNNNNTNNNNINLMLSKELMTVRRKLAEFQSQREQYHTTLERTQLDLTSKTNTLVKLREVVSELTDRDKKTTERIKELESQLADLRRELGVANDRARDSAQMAAASGGGGGGGGGRSSDPHVERRFREMRQEIAQLQRNLQAADEKIAALQRENASIADDRDSTEGRHADVIRDLEDARAEIRFKNQHIADLTFQNKEKTKWGQALSRFLAESLLYLGRSSMLDILTFAEREQQLQQQQQQQASSSSSQHHTTPPLYSPTPSSVVARQHQQSSTASTFSAAPVWREWVQSLDLSARLSRIGHRKFMKVVAEKCCNVVLMHELSQIQQEQQQQQKRQRGGAGGGGGGGGGGGEDAEGDSSQTQQYDVNLLMSQVTSWWWHQILTLVAMQHPYQQQQESKTTAPPADAGASSSTSAAAPAAAPAATPQKPTVSFLKSPTDKPFPSSSSSSQQQQKLHNPHYYRVVNFAPTSFESLEIAPTQGGGAGGRRRRNRGQQQQSAGAATMITVSGGKSSMSTCPLLRKEAAQLLSSRTVTLLDLHEHKCHIAQTIMAAWSAKARKSLVTASISAPPPVFEPKLNARFTKADLQKFAIGFFIHRYNHVKHAQNGSFSVHCPPPTEYVVGRTLSIGFCGQYEQLLSFPRNLVPLNSFLHRYIEAYAAATSSSYSSSSSTHHPSSSVAGGGGSSSTSSPNSFLVSNIDFPECNPDKMTTSADANRGIAMGRRIFRSNYDTSGNTNLTSLAEQRHHQQHSECCPIESSQPLTRLFDCVAATATGSVAGGLGSSSVVTGTGSILSGKSMEELLNSANARNVVLQVADTTSNIYRVLNDQVLQVPEGDALLKLFYLVSHNLVPEQLATDIFFNLDVLVALATDKHLHTQNQHNNDDNINSNTSNNNNNNNNNNSAFLDATTTPSGTISLPVLTQLITENGFCFRHSFTPIFISDAEKSQQQQQHKKTATVAVDDPGRTSTSVTDSGSFRRFSFTKLEISRLVFALTVDFPNQTNFSIDALSYSTEAHRTGGLVSRFALEYIQIVVDRFEKDRLALWEKVVIPNVVDASHFASSIKKGRQPFEFLPVSQDKKGVAIAKLVSSWRELHRADLTELEGEQLALALGRAMHDHTKVPAIDPTLPAAIVADAVAGAAAVGRAGVASGDSSSTTSNYRGAAGAAVAAVQAQHVTPEQCLRSTSPELRVLCQGRVHDIVLLRCLGTKDAKAAKKEGSFRALSDTSALSVNPSSSFTLGRVASLMSLGSGTDFAKQTSGANAEVIPTSVDVISAYGLLDMFYSAIHAGSTRDEETLTRLHEQLLGASTLPVAVTPPKPAAKKQRQFYNLPQYIPLDVLRHRFQTLYSGVFRPTTGESAFAERVDLETQTAPKSKEEIAREREEEATRKRLRAMQEESLHNQRVADAADHNNNNDDEGGDNNNKRGGDSSSSSSDDDNDNDDDEDANHRRRQRRRVQKPLKRKVNAVMSALMLAKNSRKSVFQLLTDEAIKNIASSPHVLDHDTLQTLASDRCAVVWNKAFDQLEGLRTSAPNIFEKNNNKAQQQQQRLNTNNNNNNNASPTIVPTTTTNTERKMGAPAESCEMLHAAELNFGFSYVEDSPDFLAWKVKTHTLNSFWNELAKPSVGSVEDAVTDATSTSTSTTSQQQQQQQTHLTTPSSSPAAGHLKSPLASPLLRSPLVAGKKHNSFDEKFMSAPVALFLKEMAPTFYPISQSSFVCWYGRMMQQQKQQEEEEDDQNNINTCAMIVPKNYQNQNRALASIGTGISLPMIQQQQHHFSRSNMFASFGASSFGFASAADNAFAASSPAAATSSSSSSASLIAVQPMQFLQQLRERCITMRGDALDQAATRKHLFHLESKRLSAAAAAAAAAAASSASIASSSAAPTSKGGAQHHVRPATFDNIPTVVSPNEKYLRAPHKPS